MLHRFKENSQALLLRVRPSLSQHRAYFYHGHSLCLSMIRKQTQYKVSDLFLRVHALALLKRCMVRLNRIRPEELDIEAAHSLPAFHTGGLGNLYMLLIAQGRAFDGTMQNRAQFAWTGID